ESPTLAFQTPVLPVNAAEPATFLPGRGKSTKTKRPTTCVVGRLVLRGPGDDLLSHGQSAISSARRRFTVLFGMGRGGANALWSPGIRLCVSLCKTHVTKGMEGGVMH